MTPIKTAQTVRKSGPLTSDSAERSATLMEAFEQRVCRARNELFGLIVQLNDHADAIFGPLAPKVVESAKGPEPTSALAKITYELGFLESLIPSLADAVERFANLA